MTIEEKAKAYDEAIERANSLLSNNQLGNAWIYKLLPELKKSEDEKIREELKEVLDICLNARPQIIKEPQYLKFINWLEKQGKEEKLTPIFRIGDTIIAKDGTYIEKELFHIDRIEDDCYWDGENTILVCNQDEFEIFKQKPTEVRTTGYWNVQDIEQKPAVETKLKIEEGKWYICISQFCNCIEGRVYKATSDSRIIDDFGTEYDMHSDAYKYFRLWTIQDAKAGDVLSYRDGQWIFIYKGIVTEDTFKYYALLSEKGITVNDAAFSLLASCIIPATKEQRDLLFQKMKEAGYEWNDEKLELKKVEQNPAEDIDLPEFESYLCLMFQKFRTKGICTNGEIIDYVKEHSQKLKDILVKPAWSEEDEHIVCFLINVTENYRIRNGFSSVLEQGNKAIDWLKSLKYRVQAKQEWTEEDEKIKKVILEALMTDDAIKILVENAIYYEGAENWFKSLKDIYIWSPSNEQMEAMQKALVDLCGKDEHNIITGLYYDLKKLREE